MEDLIIVANGDTKLPTIYISNTSHLLWLNKGNAYIYTTDTLDTSSELSPGHSTCSEYTCLCKADENLDALTLYAGDAVFHRNLNGSGLPQDDRIVCWISVNGGERCAHFKHI